MQGLSDFIAHIKKKGVFRPNRYEVHITMPQLLVDEFRSIASNREQEDIPLLYNNSLIMSITCTSVNIPGYQVMTEEIRNGNFPRKSAYDRTTEALEMTFLSTGNMDQRKFFDAWIDILFRDKHRLEYYNNYVSSVNVKCFDTSDKEIYSIELTEAYPLTITQTSLDRTEMDQTSTFHVSWAFHRILNSSVDSIEEFNDLPALSPFESFGSQSSLEDPDFSFDQTTIPDIGYVGGSSVNSVGDPRYNGTTITEGSSQNSALQNASNEVKARVGGFKDTVNGVIHGIKSGMTEVTDGIKIVRGMVKDIKSAANLPKQVLDEVVDQVNSAIQSVGVEIPGLKDINKYKVPKIKIPKV